MNWWERKPEKTAEEQEFDDAVEAYEERFDEPYQIQFGLSGGTLRETIDEIYELIRTGQKQRLKEYKEGLLY